MCLPFPPKTVSSHQTDGRGIIRQWLAEGGNPSGRDSFLQPFWKCAIERHWIGGLDELLIAGADTNQRTTDGRGWLHWCVLYDVPVWMTIQGLKPLNKTWLYPDSYGQAPYEYEDYISHSLWMFMIQKFWQEGGKLDDLKTSQFKKDVQNWLNVTPSVF